MSDLDFVHLHVHSSYSLLEGALPIARLAELAKSDKQAALALTDTDNMFGALEFSEKLAGYGIQPIIGCALAIDFGDTEHGARNANVTPERSRLVMLAASEAGYRSLMRLASRAFMDSPANEPPRLKLEWLEGETDGRHRAHRRPGGPLDFAIAAGQSHLAATRLDALIGSVWRSPLCRIAAPRPAERARQRAAADRSRLQQEPAAGCDQRAVFRHRCRPRGA